MKNILIAILLLTISFSVFSEAETNWGRADGVDDGKPVSIRFRQNIPAGIDIDSYPYLVIISWEYTPANESGFPTPEVVGLMGEIENSFADAIESNGYLTMTFLGNGIREWQIYTKDVSKLEIDFNQAIKKYQTLPLKLKTQKDIGWRSYFSLLPAK